MTVDEALKQLKFIPQKGARVVEEVIQEAQEMAVKEHHFEYATNMWVSESFTDNFDKITGMRRHKGGRCYTMSYRFCSYFLTSSKSLYVCLSCLFGSAGPVMFLFGVWP